MPAPAVRALACLRSARGERARSVRRTGARLDCEVATVFDLRDGKIARTLAMADMAPIVDAYRDVRPAT